MPFLTEKKDRRSTRVLVNIPLVLSGVNSRGERVEAAGETLVVNKHGAKIRTLEPLERGMKIQVTIPSRKLSRGAQVVWVDERDQTQAELDFGVELDTAENFWGIYFPPEDWREADSWKDEEVAVGAALRPAPAPLSQTAPGKTPSEESLGSRISPALVPAASPSQSAPVVIPAVGSEVYVRGMSAVRIPFQERTYLRLVGENEATIDLRPVVDVGVMVQVIFPATKLGLKARTSAVGTNRREGRWRMWIRFLDPFEIGPLNPVPSA